MQDLPFFLPTSFQTLKTVRPQLLPHQLRRDWLPVVYQVVFIRSYRKSFDRHLTAFKADHLDFLVRILDHFSQDHLPEYSTLVTLVEPHNWAVSLPEIDLY